MFKRHVLLSVLSICLMSSQNSYADQGEKPKEGLRGIINLADWYYSKYNLNMKKEFIDGKERKDYSFLSLPIQVKLTTSLNQEKSIFGSLYINYNIKDNIGDDSWDNTYYLNNQINVFGGSIGYAKEFKLNKNDPKSEYIGGFSTSLFGEYQLIDSSFVSSQDSVPDDNIKTGITFWYSRKLNPTPLFSGVKGRFWTETWGELAYQSTMFVKEGQNDYVILNVIPRAGISFDLSNYFALEPYAIAGLNYNLKQKNTWNNTPYNNYSIYGPAVRLTLKNDNIKWLSGEPHLYAEYLNVNYLPNVRNDNLDYAHDHSWDWRIGLSYWGYLF